MTDRLAMITARVPPAICGVGDYVHRLWEAWPEASGRDWTVLVTEHPEASQAAWPEVLVRGFERSAAGLAGALEASGADVAVLQYVGFGFHRKGAPLWLPRGLRRWKEARGGRRLVVMMHELWGHAPPWRPVWAWQFAQRRAIGQLGRLADGLLTSTETNRALLHQRFGIQAEVTPSPSNVPVLATPPGTDAARSTTPDRPLRVLVFGMASTRAKALRAHRGVLAGLAGSERLDRLEIVGRGATANQVASSDREAINDAAVLDRVCSLGELSMANLSTTLTGADLMLCGQQRCELGKSGTAKAALSHGCPVLALAGGPAAPDAPAVLSHDGSPGSIRELLHQITSGELERLGREGRQWYLDHSDWPMVVKAYEQVLGHPATIST